MKQVRIANGGLTWQREECVTPCFGDVGEPLLNQCETDAPPPISPLRPFSTVVLAAHSLVSQVPCSVIKRSTEPASLVTKYL